MNSENPERAPAWLIRSILAMSAMAVVSAEATTINVTTAADVVGADGKCSLREAISNVNTHGMTVAGTGECAAGNAINDTIVLPAGTYLLSILGAGENNNASGDLDIKASVDIQGAGMGQTIVDGNDADRVFDIQTSGLNVSLQDLTITHGHLPGHRSGGTADNAADGGAIFVQNGTLGLLRIELSSNKAGSGSMTDATNNAGGDGGAIFTTDTTLTIIDSVFTDNRSGDGVIVSGNDGYGGNGGAIEMLGGSLLIQGSSFSGNQTADGTSQTAFAGPGGAIFTQTGGVTIQRSAFDSNATGSGATGRQYGGALFFGGAVGTYSIEQSSITRNHADVAAGMFVGNNLNISNTTVADNEADTRGGGIYFDSVTVQFDFVTVTENTAPSAPGIYAKNTYFSVDSTTSQANLRNTIVAHNHGGNGCVTGDAHSFYNSQGHNISGAGCPDDGVTDIATTTPLLGPLASNGGIGLSHMPMIGSPALDAGSCTASALHIDQRDHVRPADIPRIANVADACDIGAVELDDDLFWDGFDG